MKLDGVDIGKEESRTKNMALLGEMLELQEWVETAKEKNALEKVARDIKARVERALALVASYFDEHTGTKERSADALNELRYLRRLLERIDTKLEEVV